jgi:hypothetical protein
MARTAAASTASDSAIAAVMAAVFATMSSAFAFPFAPGSSDSAIDRAEALRFSMTEMGADFDRSNTPAKGAISPPSSASKRVMSSLASSMSVSAVGASVRFRLAIECGIAAWKGPLRRDREYGSQNSASRNVSYVTGRSAAIN